MVVMDSKQDLYGVGILILIFLVVRDSSQDLHGG